MYPTTTTTTRRTNASINPAPAPLRQDRQGRDPAQELSRWQGQHEAWANRDAARANSRGGWRRNLPTL